MPYRGRTIDIVFDFTQHRLDIETSDGRSNSFELRPMTVADFYAELMQALRRLDIEIRIPGPCPARSRAPCRSIRIERTRITTRIM